MIEDLTEKLVIFNLHEVEVEKVLVLGLRFHLVFLGFFVVFDVFDVFVIFVVFFVAEFELIESWVCCQVCEVLFLRAGTLCRLAYSHKVARFT